MCPGRWDHSRLSAASPASALPYLPFQAWADAGITAVVHSAMGMFLVWTGVSTPPAILSAPGRPRSPRCPIGAHRGRSQAWEPGQGEPWPELPAEPPSGTQDGVPGPGRGCWWELLSALPQGSVQGWGRLRPQGGFRSPVPSPLLQESLGTPSGGLLGLPGAPHYCQGPGVGPQGPGQVTKGWRKRTPG